MNKVVVNGCYGGFVLSEKAIKRYREISGKVVPSNDIPRHDPALIQVVEELGKDANAECASLLIEEIPGNRYRIHEYDGLEEIHCPEGEDWIVIED